MKIVVIAVGLSVKNYILSVDKAIIKVLYVLLSQYYFLPSWETNCEKLWTASVDL